MLFYGDALVQMVDAECREVIKNILNNLGNEIVGNHRGMAST